MEKIYVSRPVFDKLESKCSCVTLSENSRAKGSITHNKEVYVIVGSKSSYEEGYIEFYGIKAVSLQNYTGSLKPLKYDEALYDRYAGNRDVGYNGMLIECDNRMMVLVGEEIIFRPIETEIQLQMQF